MKYFAKLTGGKITLWCYLIWYVFFAARYFDPSRNLWLTSLGLSGIIGIALILSTTGATSRLDRWQLFRQFLTPFCASTLVELVKCEWSKYKDVLALGGYDITHHLIMYFLKPIEQELDVKITAGIHTGCLRVQASTKGNIHKVADLRGKKIGVPGMGTPPFI